MKCEVSASGALKLRYHDEEPCSNAIAIYAKETFSADVIFDQISKMAPESCLLEVLRI